MEEDRFYRELCSSETLRSGKKGFFRDFSENVENIAGDAWITSTFGDLSSDEERVKVLLTHPRMKETVVNTLDRVKHIYRDKDARISRCKRLEGIKFSSARENTRALVLLSQAVLRAPVTGRVKEVDDGCSLSLALVARADVLMTLGESVFAIEDLEAAANEDIPKIIRSQIDLKLIKCRQQVEESSRAVVSLDCPKRNTYRKPVPPQLTDGRNSTFQGLSKLVEIRETAKEGKHAVALNPVRVGDVLATEPPLASCLLPEHYGTHCHHCFVRLRAPVGCPFCSTVAFCDKRCRNEAAESYHKYECKILALLIGSGMSILSMLALRMVTQCGLESSLKIHRECNDPSRTQEVVLEKKEGHMSKSAKRRLRKKKLMANGVQNKCIQEIDSRAYELITHKSMRSASDFFQRTLMAAFLLKCLTIVGFFENTRETIDSPTNEEIIVGSLLLRNLQLLQFNAHEICEARSSDKHRFRGNKTVYLGIAIYPSVARFNHDCYPGVTRYFAGRDIVIRAMRPLKPGEIVAENYGPIFTKRSLKERQRTLNGRYWFKCSCRACAEDWPGFDDLVDYPPRFRCTSAECPGLLTQSSKGRYPTKCPVCHKKINLDKRMENLRECEENYKLGFTSMESEKLEDAVLYLTEGLEKFHTIASPPHRETHLAEIALATCMAESGNTWNLSIE